MTAGNAGWCMAAGNESSGGCGGGAGKPSKAIVAETCRGAGSHVDVSVLTRGDAVAVAVKGGSPIATFTNATLPDGIRAAAIEVSQRNRRIDGCPKVAAFDRHGDPIYSQRKHSLRLVRRLSHVRTWEPPERQPDGACELTTQGLPSSFSVDSGGVATRVGPERGLVGQALLACADIVYLYNEEHHLNAAVLVDAAHPGTIAPQIPGMRRVAGHPGVFESPGAAGQRVERPITGGWLIVEEEDGIGLRAPLEILERLHASVPLG